jgi:hypothetical protein
VVQIERETDIERLRHVALLQHAELTRPHERLAALTAALAAARGEVATTSLQLELQLLQEQLAAKTRALFSPSSERRPSDGADAEDAPLSTLHRRPRGRRRMTRGRRGSLLLRREALSSFPSCRFIPAHYPFGEPRR